MYTLGATPVHLRTGHRHSSDLVLLCSAQYTPQLSVVSRSVTTTAAFPATGSPPPRHCCRLLQLSLVARTTRQQEKDRAIESAARVDGEAALSQRPPTALLHASTADRHHSDLNSCRLAGRTAAAQRMTMRSFVLHPSCWRGWSGPSWGPWAAKDVSWSRYGHLRPRQSGQAPSLGSAKNVACERAQSRPSHARHGSNHSAGPGAGNLQFRAMLVRLFRWQT